MTEERTDTRPVPIVQHAIHASVSQRRLDPEALRP